MDLIRLGEKLSAGASLTALSVKSSASGQKGLSQTEVASRLGVDRTLVCRLESLGKSGKGAGWPWSAFRFE